MENRIINFGYPKLLKTILLVFALLPTIIGLQAQEINYLGTPGYNTSRVVKYLDGFVYVASRNANDQGALHKLATNGDLVWSQTLATDMVINDFDKNGPTIFIVGTESTNDAFRNSVLSRVIDNGANATLDFTRYFPSVGRDGFNEVFFLGGNSWVLQHQYQPTASNGNDEVVISFFGNNGNIVLENRFNAGDDQYWFGIRADQSTYTMLGNMGGPPAIGAMVELDGSFNLDRAFTYPELFNLRDYLDLDNGRKIMVGEDNNNGVIMEIASDGSIVWAKKINESLRLRQIEFIESLPVANGTKDFFYVLGDHTDPNIGYFIAKIQSTNTSGAQEASTQSIVWGKHLNDGSSVSGSPYFEFDGSQILYSDTRTSAIDGFGNEDVLVALLDDEFTSCITEELDLILDDKNITPTVLNVNEPTRALPILQDYTYQGIDSSFLTSGTCLPDSCETSTLILNTGVDHINELYYNVGDQDAYWTLVDMPNAPNSFSGYAPFVINPNNAWTTYPDSRWISAFNNTSLDENNPPPISPYSYQMCFCVSEDNSTVVMDFDVLADDQCEVVLTDQSNTVLSVLSPLPAGSAYQFIHPAEIDTSFNLDAGTYCIRVDGRNRSSVAMGVNVNGTLSSATYLDHLCCRGTVSSITGQKFHDKNCDGNYSGNELSQGIPGWKIILCNESGDPIDSTLTDSLGFYYFENLLPGQYLVKEEQQGDWVQTMPGSGVYTVNLGLAEVAGSLHFGNKYEGPVVVDSLTDRCVTEGSYIRFSWEGQVCDCTMKIKAKPCFGGEPGQIIATIPNTGSYNWQVPAAFAGLYEFTLIDCDGNEIDFPGCVSISNYVLQISYEQIDCGKYVFSYEIEGLDSSQIVSDFWTFGAEGNSIEAIDTAMFANPGTYEVCQQITTIDGCVIEECIFLTVEEGSDDPDCCFCPPGVLQELEGDLFVSNKCYGVILQSPEGGCYRIAVNDDGLLTTEPVDCPATE